MHTNDKNKTTEERLAECVNIRAQLQSLGVLSIPKAKEDLTRYMNAFVKNGDPATFKVKIPGSETCFQIILTKTVGKNSGVVMQK